MTLKTIPDNTAERFSIIDEPREVIFTRDEESDFLIKLEILERIECKTAWITRSEAEKLGM